MIEYNLITLTFKFAPLLIFIAGWWFLKDRRFFLRYPAMVFGGWAMFLIFSLIYWPYAIQNAPSQDIAMALAERDGAPKVFALYFGWLYSFVLLLILDGCYKLVRFLTKRKI